MKMRDVPEDFVDNEDNIALFPPRGRIRSDEQLRDHYHIDSIFCESEVCNAVIDRLRMVDWFEYVLNNTESEYPGCDNMLQSYALSNLMSIIEAFIQESVQRCYESCQKRQRYDACRDCKTCRNYFEEGKDHKLWFKKSVDAFFEHGLIDAIDRSALHNVYDSRNEIHIRQLFFRDQALRDYDYEAALVYLDVIADKCFMELVPYYDKCRGYEEKIPEADQKGREDNEIDDSTQQLSETEKTILELIKPFSEIAYIDEKAFHENFLMASGDMPVRLRTITKRLADYLIDNFDNFVMLLILDCVEGDGSYIKYWVEHVEDMKSLCETSNENTIKVCNRYNRKILNSEDVKSSLEGVWEYYRGDLGYYTIDAERINKDVLMQIIFLLSGSLHTAQDMIAPALERLTEDNRKAIGFIFSNWMYVISSFLWSPLITKELKSCIEPDNEETC